MSSPSSASSSREKYRALLSSASKTAGCDNWKTSAGRANGPDGFVVGDTWRILKLHFKTTSKPPVCPVCMDRPNHDDWYITKSCKHAVCKSCLQSYASSLISDPNHTGPLRCPCCPRLLRVEDAKVALDNQLCGNESQSVSMRAAPKAVMKHAKSKRHERGRLFDEPENGSNTSAGALEVLERWDNKKRDEILRSMRDFRPCPHCQHKQNREGGDSNGGGFVTPECLAPINDKRESKAERLMQFAGAPASQTAILGYVIYYLYCMGGSEESAGNTSAAFRLLLVLLPSVMLPIVPHVICLALSTMARKEIMRPIVVTCPCCGEDFNLAASSELQLADASSGSAAEDATERWKSSNTRPCPSCASPIVKDGGCNHIKCGRCRVSFCWACMRPQTTCQSYRCKNGAPYGNAFGDGSLAAVRAGLAAAERELAGQTLIERIDHVEALARRNLGVLQSLPLQYAALICTAFACIYVLCLARSSKRLAFGAWIIIRRIVSMVVNSLLTSLRLLCFVALFSYFVHQTRRPNLEDRNNRRQRFNTHRFHRPNLLRRRSISFRRLGFRTEEEQVAEAIARSLADQ